MSIKDCWIVIGMAFSYWLAGTLSGWLAIPPGFSSPVWPAAGIALIGSLRWGWPAIAGVVLGSFNINISISGLSFWQPSINSFSPLIIALGAGIQAWLGARLLHPFTSAPKFLESSSNVIKVNLLAGPVSCLISASIGVTTLIAAGIIDIKEAAINWGTWWVGDSIGVMIFIPVLALLNWHKHWTHKQQILQFALPYATLTLLVIYLFNSARIADLERIQALFHERTNSYHQAIHKHLQAIEHQEQILAKSFQVFNGLNRQQFDDLTSHINQLTPGTQALSWVRYVLHAERQSVEQELVLQGAASGITERLPGVGLVRALPRKDYYSVFYITPLKGNEKALGFDIGSNRNRRDAVELAIKTGSSAATEPLTLVQENAAQLAFLLLTPVITQDGQVKGVISGVYRTGDLFRAALSGLAGDEVAIKVMDVTNDRHQLLYKSQAKGSSIEWSQTVPFALRQWDITYSPSVDYLRKKNSWTVWGVLVGGFLLVIVLGTFMLVLLSRNHVIAKEVAEKTIALNKALEDSEQASRAKSQFLANMSHELRTPLNSILGFTTRIQKKIGKEANPQILDGLSTVIRNSKHLLNLITEVLDIAKIEAGKMAMYRSDVELIPLLNEAIDTMSSHAKEKNLSLRMQPCPVNVLYVDPQRFVQILLNLLSNAIKFTDSGSVDIGFKLEERNGLNGLIIEVCDTGKGISEEKIPLLFSQFQQLSENNIATQGTGLGLVLSKKMMELHHGSIDVFSQVNVGTRFVLWFPLEKLECE